MQYALRITGFDVRAVRRFSRQIRRTAFDRDFKRSGDVAATAAADKAKRALEKSL